MPRRIEPPPSRGRQLYPDADPEALAWVAEKARAIVDAGRGVGWDWIDLAEDDCEPDPEEKGPAARVFDGAGGTVTAVTEGC